MTTLAELCDSEQSAFEDAAAALLSAGEMQRRSVSGPRRPGIAELWAYALDRNSVDAVTIRASISEGGRTARDWRAIQTRMGAVVLTFAAAASSEDDGVAADNTARNLRLDIKPTDADSEVFTLVLDLSNSDLEQAPEYLSVGSAEQPGYLEIKLEAPYRGVIQMYVGRAVAEQLIEARRSPSLHEFHIW